jgi:hypothetical protein
VTAKIYDYAKEKEKRLALAKEALKSAHLKEYVEWLRKIASNIELGYLAPSAMLILYRVPPRQLWINKTAPDYPYYMHGWDEKELGDVMEDVITHAKKVGEFDDYES